MLIAHDGDVTHPSTMHPSTTTSCLQDSQLHREPLVTT